MADSKELLVPIKGETVVLTPPVPSPKKNIAITNPATLAEALFTAGREETKSATQPQRLRLLNISTRNLVACKLNLRYT